MRTPLLRRMGLAAASAALLVALAGCAGGASWTTEEDPTVVEESTDSGTDAGASGEMYGCTAELLDYATSNGYPDGTPADPATFEIPQVQFDQAPACYISDDYGGSPRHSAFWTDDPEGTLAALGAALTAAGYEQNDDYGPLVWWLNGTGPTDAEVAISAAPQPVGGTPVLWAAW